VKWLHEEVGPGQLVTVSGAVRVIVESDETGPLKWIRADELSRGAMLWSVLRSSIDTALRSGEKS